MTTPTSSQHAKRDPHVAMQFDNAVQQEHADALGMWLFLASEVLFFGGLFTIYLVYRHAYPEPFAHASRQLDVVLGTINTALLLASSFTVALSVAAARANRRGLLMLLLAITIVLGSAFIGIKITEYIHKIEAGHGPQTATAVEHSDPARRHEQLFYNLYFGMTGLHAIHMLIGIGAFGVLLVMAWRSRLGGRNYMPMEITGLYWHFVDIVWIFLFPMMYLIDRAP